jgi:polysaccharide export outer membrane protein
MIIHNIKQHYLKHFLSILLAVLFTGCASSRKINYFQDQEDVALTKTVTNYEPTIQYGDLLNINVSSVEPELAAPFNTFEIQENRMVRQIPYLVNVDNEINFPVLGKINVAQLTTKEVTSKINDLLLKYLNGPAVSVQLMNFKVSVLGEVRSPGSYTIQNERINILEALALAGDLTIYGKRETVTLIREQNGIRELIPIDLTSKELFNSPYYYLSQNDIIYVEGNKTRVNSSKVGPNTAIVVSSLSILISLAAILIN